MATVFFHQIYDRESEVSSGPLPDVSRLLDYRLMERVPGEVAKKLGQNAMYDEHLTRKVGLRPSVSSNLAAMIVAPSTVSPEGIEDVNRCLAYFDHPECPHREAVAPILRAMGIEFGTQFPVPTQQEFEEDNSAYLRSLDTIHALDR